MAPGYLMDTNAVIDFLSRKLPESAKNIIIAIEPVISIITQIELFSSNKTSEQELMQLKAFINAATVYTNIDEDIADHTIFIRKNYKIKTPDAIIAATAQVYNLILITRNVSDFNKIPDLKLLNPWDI